MNAPTHTQSPEWGNENALRAYPLADDCPAATRLPTWLLSDLHITVADRYESVFVSSAYLSETLISVSVSGVRTVGGASVIEGLLARTVTRDELEPYRAYSMDVLGGTATGSVAFGSIPAAASPFHMSFSPAEAPLVVSAVVRTSSPGVESIVDADNGVETDGIVDLSGNSEFRTYLDPTDPTTVVFELTDLYRDMTTSVCSSTPSLDACGEQPVLSVNGVRPDESGTITLKFR